MSVLLPAPFWPTIAQTSPDATERSTPSTATVAPKVLRIPRISNRDAAGVAAAITASARGRLGVPVNVELLAPNALPRFAFKAARVVDEN